MKKQPGIIICHAEYENIRKVLTQEQKGDLLDLLMEYGETGKVYDGGDPLLQIAFNMFSASIQRMQEKYYQRCERNKENARKRWEQQYNGNVANACDRMQTDTKSNEQGETITQTETQTEKKKKSIFIPPTIAEVLSYCQERGNNIDPEQFCDYYSARGWELKPGAKVKDWKALIRTWEKNRKERENDIHGTKGSDNIPGQRTLYAL